MYSTTRVEWLLSFQLQVQARKKENLYRLTTESFLESMKTIKKCLLKKGMKI